MANDLMEEIFNEARKKEREEQKVPLKIAVMGQTGVGKTSLINALFNTKLKKDAVIPTTLEIRELRFLRDGYELLLYDLPGIGESKRKDAVYLQKYRQKLREADIVLWAVHADSRSFVYDFDALDKVLETPDEQYRKDLFRKFTFVLTKADLVIADYQSSSPWILADFRDYAIFVPQKRTKELLAEKETYLQRILFDNYRNIIVSQTYRDENFKINKYGLSYDENHVYYDGVLDENRLVFLKRKFPQHQVIFERLYNNYRVISCSSYFRYNLDLLMEIIINKLDLTASLRFSNFYKKRILGRLPTIEAKKRSNLIVVDQIGRQVIYDLTKLPLPSNNTE